MHASRPLFETAVSVRAFTTRANKDGLRKVANRYNIKPRRCRPYIQSPVDIVYTELKNPTVGWQEMWVESETAISIVRLEVYPKRTYIGYVTRKLRHRKNHSNFASLNMFIKGG